MATLKEKIGYGFGDMSSSMFWKIFSYYLPFFYSNIFGLSLADAGLLMLVTRIWDAVSDPMMGVIADRTHTRWGKYRPYLLWIAAPFAIAGILLFTTPDMGTTGKLVWAYVTYILMMTVYTAINVPYGAMLGVMTDDSNTKTVFSSYRMFFAYGGSFIALGAWEPLCNWFKSMDYSNASSWQYAMVCIATLCFLGFLFCFSMTREHVKSVASESIGNHRQRKKNYGHRRPVQAQQRRQQHQQSHGDPGKARDAVRAGPVLLARKRPRQLDAHGAVLPDLRQVVTKDQEQQSHEHRYHGADGHLIAQPCAEGDRPAEQRYGRAEPQQHRPQYRIPIFLRLTALGVKADEMQCQNKQRQAEHSGGTR